MMSQGGLLKRAGWGWGVDSGIGGGRAGLQRDLAARAEAP